MLSYVMDIGVIDWCKYGFRWDEETQSLEPVIEVQSTENGNSNTLINIESTKTNQTRPECHREHLENIFKKQSHISRKKIDDIAEATGLTRKQIRDWFSKARKKMDIGKENINPNKKMRI